MVGWELFLAGRDRQFLKAGGSLAARKSRMSGDLKTGSLRDLAGSFLEPCSKTLSPCLFQPILDCPIAIECLLARLTEWPKDFALAAVEIRP